MTHKLQSKEKVNRYKENVSKILLISMYKITDRSQPKVRNGLDDVISLIINRFAYLIILLLHFEDLITGFLIDLHSIQETPENTSNKVSQFALGKSTSDRSSVTISRVRINKEGNSFKTRFLWAI